MPTTAKSPIVVTAQPISDGYATIRSRGLMRQSSIRIKELSASRDDEPLHRIHHGRKRTLSLMSSYSNSSSATNYSEHPRRQSTHSAVSDELYSRPHAKPVKTPTIADIEPIYSNCNSGTIFRPKSIESSCSGGCSATHASCRDSILFNSDNQNNSKKNSRFSLDSFQSSATPKTPDYNTAGEEESLYLYVAPKSPKTLPDGNVRSSFEDPKSCSWLPVPMQSVNKIQEDKNIQVPSEEHWSYNSPGMNAHSIATRSSAVRSKEINPFRRTFSLCEKHRPSTLALSSEKPSKKNRIRRSPSIPPPAPVRRESLLVSVHASEPPRLLEQPELDNQASGATVHLQSCCSQSISTLDQEEVLSVPIAMPVLPNPASDRRYHTLGHLRGRSLGANIHRSFALHLKSATDLTSLHGPYSVIRSTSNLYASADAAVADLNRMAPEYMDPLDFKIGCQTMLRSKPLIPWYDLAIRRSVRRQSCPPTSTLSLSADTTNQAHVVSAFEQSLSNMTGRLQQLTATAERKDGELTDMRQTIELLRKQSIQAGLTTAHMQSMGVQTQGQSQNQLLGKSSLNNSINGKPSYQKSSYTVQQTNGTATPPSSSLQRRPSTDSLCSLNSIASNCSMQDKKHKKKGWLRSSFTKAFSRNAKISKTNRHSTHHQQMQSPHLLGSYPGSPTLNGQRSRNHYTLQEEITSYLPTSTAQSSVSQHSATPKDGSPAKTVTLIENAKPIDAIETEESQLVEELKKQLREKDLVLTDIRLEALSSASQLENLKEAMSKMRNEMMILKHNNERLKKIVETRSLTGSEVNLVNAISPADSTNESRRYSLAEGSSRPKMELPVPLPEECEEENIPPAPAPDPPPSTQPQPSPTTHIDLTPPPPAVESSPTHLGSTVGELTDMSDGKKIAIACYLGQPESFAKYCDEVQEVEEFYANNAIMTNHHERQDVCIEHKTFPSANLNEFVIAYTYISGKTTWQNLDYIVRKTFKDYIARIDPGTNLALNTDSITSYHLGEAKRGPEMGFPELLPCGYIIGNVRTLYICLQGVGSLAFDSLIPRNIMQRYINLLNDHRRLILCGPSGTGKSYLARRLAEFLVIRSGRGNLSEAIATFNVDHKSSKDLHQYLGHIVEQAAIANGDSELPTVIILDNLHHASALGDVFSSLSTAGPATKLPYIIGAMSQATCNTTNLQLQHNFRWVLTSNQMEPVKGFLGRFLRRRLFQLELQSQRAQPELATVLAWLPNIWQHINRFLEVHSSSDVTIGPRLFLSCPLDLKDSQVWFTDMWNYHLSPYLIEAVREGVQLYGRRGTWNDPSLFIRSTYPWPYELDSVPPLRQINAEDVGLEGAPVNSSDNQDPLLNMLMRLQEAANYSENQEQESDCASLDSNITPDSSACAE